MKLLSIILFIFIFSTSSFAKESLPEKKKIIIKGDSQYPPFEYINVKGEPDGFNIQILKAVMEEMGEDYTIQLQPWDSVISSLDKKKIDMVSGMLYTPERASKYIFAQESCSIHPNIITREEDSYPNIQALKNKQIIIVDYTSSYEYLVQNNCASNIIKSKHLFVEIENLSKGKYDAIVCSSELARYVMNKAGLTNLDIHDFELPTIPFGAVSHDKDLINRYNLALSEIKSNGTYAKIYNHWFEKPTDNKISQYIYIIFGSLLLISLILYFFNYVLRKQVKRNSALLIEKNQRLSLAIKAGNICVWSYNIKEKKIYNISGDFLGCDGDSLDCFLNALHPEDLEPFKIFFDNLTKGITTDKTVLIRIKNKDTDKWEYGETEFAITIGKDRCVENIIGTFKNITDRIIEQKRLDNIMLRYQSVFENTLVGLSYFDSNGHLIEVNEAVCKMLGISEDVLIDFFKERSLYDSPLLKHLFDKHGKSKGWEELVKLNFGNKQQNSFLNASSIRNNRIISVKTTPILNSAGEIEGTTLALFDVTSQEIHKHRLQESYKKLALEKKKAEEADKFKSNFLANMSHEIRTPLNAIVGFSQLLYDCDDPEEKTEFINIINTNTEILLNLIGDILDLSKIESGLIDLKYEEFDFVALFHELTSSFQSRIKNPNISFSATSKYKKFMITLDKNRVAQILTNYISNAIKYTPTGSIEAGYEYVDNGLKIFVTDTGIGVDESKKNKLFHRFEKLDSFAQGTGLGLSICKAIAENVNGKVGCESEVGKGSTFWAWIPCSALFEE